MKANLRLLTTDPPIHGKLPTGSIFEVLDYTLFMYGLVRGDRILVNTVGPFVYEELAVYELDGRFRLGIPYYQKRSWLTALSGLVTASKVEFDLDPGRKSEVRCHGKVAAVVESALRGVTS